ncbi:ATP-binding protein [Millisia brevis]|uniref:ATP-binding protein n=1 Tax=Millisia brevis TaxID=264148 RepID=UPI000833DB2E|nr:biotin carboxylase N-terminal domain-containing protein [Millisia brevis]
MHTVLIANRGEITVRIARSVRALGLQSVAVYTDADASALHRRVTDKAVRVDSYLDIEAILEAARRTGADAIHPGYGFLAENAAFARACAEAGVTFIGPPVEAIEVMGDKITAKTAVGERGVPLVPGLARPGLTDDEIVAAADDVGFPVLIKPSAGGGGKGMHVVEKAADMAAAVAAARREAASSFGDDTLFLERYVTSPRHIEVQVLADTHGNVIHLGERECSLQRRHQKVIEEAPSPLLDAAARERIGEAACETARSVGYVGAGTVEFLVAGDTGPDEFFFMEMNTRLQVEHPVTELVTGVDLVEWQLRIARGEVLDIGEIALTGHAIEARVYAEDPGRGFLPTGGTVLALRDSAQARVDSGIAVGSVIGSDYDPMLAKVIVHGADRAEALERLDAALADTAILGVGTNIAFLRTLLADDDVRAGDLDTGLVDRFIADYASPTLPASVPAIAAVTRRAEAVVGSGPWEASDGWRIGRTAPFLARFAGHEVSLAGRLAAVTRTDSEERPSVVEIVAENGAVVIDGTRREVLTAEAPGGGIWVAVDGATWFLGPAPATHLRGDDAGDRSATIVSPMPGTVIAVLVEEGATVEEGTRVVVVEAMKMEHSLTAPLTGTVHLQARVGDRVAVDAPLASVVPDAVEDESTETDQTPTDAATAEEASEA